MAMVAATGRAGAADAWSPRPGDVALADFAFGDGETLGRLNLHYLTLGTPIRAADGRITNAIMLLHGTTGSGSQFLAPSFADAMFGPGQPLDIKRFYVVMPDGIGAGGSSKPSDGLHARFPHYGYGDQVKAQRVLLDRLGIARLKLVLGTSMGGMQTWLWGETYPDDADALVAVASTPAAIAGRNMLWRAMIIQAIRTDPAWNDGNYARNAPPQAWLRTAIPLFAVMTGNPEQLEKLAPTRTAATQALQALEEKAASIDANDYLYTFESSADYDPVPHLAAITRPILALNFADDLLNPPALLRLPHLPKLDHVLLPGGDASFGHQTLAHADRYAAVLKGFLAKIPGW
jgi:homoserine O-acetyltransferase